MEAFLPGYRYHVVGINYHPGYRGCYEWVDFREKEIEKDFSLMKELGIELVRIFLFWEDFEPFRGNIDDEKIKLLKKVTRIARKYDLKLVVTFFVGNMSGGVFDPKWRRGDIYNNPMELITQVSHIRKIVSELKDEEAIYGWDISNEVYWYGGFTDTNSAELWCRVLVSAIRETGDKRPVTNGIDQASLTGITGFLPWKIDRYFDYMCVHSYPIYDSFLSPEPTLGLRPTYLPVFALKIMRALTNKPVILQEFGHTTGYASDDRIAGYMRLVMYGSLLAGSVATMPWCFSDVENTKEYPYNIYPHEIEFGIVRTDRTLKPSAEELKRFASFVKRLGEYRLEKSKIAILISSDWYFDAKCSGRLKRFPENPHDSSASALAAYMTLRGLGFTVDLCLPDTVKNYEAVFVPSCKHLTVEDLSILADYVKGGGKLYVSYGAKLGYVGLGSPLFRELLGITVEDRFICPDEVSLRVEDKDLVFKTHIPGSMLRSSMSYAEISPNGSETIGSVNGKPAIVENNYGDGKVIFCSFPIEAICARALPFTIDELSTFYSFIASRLELKPETYALDPRVEVGRIFSQVGEEIILILNHVECNIETKVNTPQGTVNVSLEPGEVKIITQKEDMTGV